METMEKLERCPECHKVIIPDGIIAEWERKWGTNEKPHYLAECKICGEPAGEHYGTECPVIHSLSEVWEHYGLNCLCGANPRDDNVKATLDEDLRPVTCPECLDLL